MEMSAPSDPKKPSTWVEWKTWIGQRWWLYPFARIEWASEWLYYRLRSLALFDLLELAGRCTVLVVAILWVLDADNRAKERHYRAWDLINAARGSSGDGGRRDALQDLNEDGVSLDNAPLTKAWLPKVDLHGAQLEEANLQGANLQQANLRGGNFTNANLEGANLQRADLQEAYVIGTKLQRSILIQANLQHALMENAHLEGARIGFADLMGADLRHARLQGADLQDARNVTQDQLDAADGDDRTQLPDGLTRPAHLAEGGRRQRPAYGTTG
jgi:hypothetical protein